MSNETLPPDQFLYGRAGPWPQPSPSHPLGEAAEVLNIPPLETLLWNSTIGARYLQTQIGYPPAAAAAAVQDLGVTTPTNLEFDRILFASAYTRYFRPLTDADRQRAAGRIDLGKGTWAKYDFSAMKLVQPLEGMYCAPVVLYAQQDTEHLSSTWYCQLIDFRNDNPALELLVGREDSSWDLAKIYALQGAAYHTLFVMHPALHFPMDAVNAITKTAVPYTHPLFQLLFPHTSYTLALDNAVLESPNSVVNNNVQGTWFDPLTSGAYNLKLLFAAGYAGLSDPFYGNAYPAYDYMKPQMGFASEYGRWLKAYYERAFLPFCSVVAKTILSADPTDTYVARWARYNHSYVQGFPDEKQILDPQCLAQVLAIYLWDVSVSHGADHYSFGIDLPVAYKFLRIRRAPPQRRDEPPVAPGQIFNGDDAYRAHMANQMFFRPWTIAPNLNDTYYAFTNPVLAQAQVAFHQALTAVANDPSLHQFMALSPSAGDAAAYALTIPASIQY